MGRKAIYLLIALISTLGGPLLGQNLSARDYFLLGAAKYKCNACKEAVEDFTKAIQLDPKYADALYGRSLAYKCMGDYRAALRDIEGAIRLSPNEVLFLEGRARVRSESGDIKGAVRDFSEATEKDPLCWQAWYGLGVSAHALKDTAAARKGYTHAIAQQPDFPMAWLGRGQLEIEKGNPAAALPDLANAAELAPRYAPVFEATSLANLELGHYEAAQAAASTAINLEPSRALPFYYRAEALRLQEKCADADLDYEMATKLDRRMAMAIYKRGVCQDTLRDNKAAIKHYSAAVGRDKSLKAAYVARSAVWVREGKPKKAISDLSAALKIGMEDVDLRIRRGFLYLEILENQRALQDFGQAIKRAPENGTAYYGNALAKYEEGNVKGACSDWKRALELGEIRAADYVSRYCVE